MSDEPSEEEMKQRRGCAEGFFEAIGCGWIIFGCLVLVLLPLGMK